MESEVNRRVLCQRAYYEEASRHAPPLRPQTGVLLSWALPEEPSCCSGAIRKAIEMEDHRRANLLFEGVHETGPIMLWDRGTWEPHLESNDIESSLRRGILRFTLRGEKLKGGWTLARMNNARNAPRPIWTLCKQADSFAGSRADLIGQPKQRALIAAANALHGHKVELR